VVKYHLFSFIILLYYNFAIWQKTFSQKNGIIRPV
jgi:hypothetical protein